MIQTDAMDLKPAQHSVASRETETKRSNTGRESCLTAMGEGSKQRLPPLLFEAGTRVPVSLSRRRDTASA
jgi:hypothetical protein